MEEAQAPTLTAAAAGIPAAQVPASTTVAPVVLPGMPSAPVVASDKK